MLVPRRAVACVAGCLMDTSVCRAASWTSRQSPVLGTTSGGRKKDGRMGTLFELILGVLGWLSWLNICLWLKS